MYCIFMCSMANPQIVHNHTSIWRICHKSTFHSIPRFYESQHNFLNVVSKLLIIIIEIVIVFLLRFCIEILTEFEKMSLVIEGTNASPRINKRPMGHIAQLRNQFKSINTCDYNLTLINRRQKI